MNQIVVAFSPGTSGKFISTISYMLENDLHSEIEWTKFNSAHDLNIDTKFSLLFNEILFINKGSWTVKYIHEYPEFKKIKNKIPNCKFILIGYTKDNLTEVIFNGLLKNQKLDNDPLVNISNMVNERKIDNLRYVANDPFIKEIVIPEEYKEDTLVFMYDDIFKEENNSFTALEKISKFLNKPINEYILKSYKNYVNGQKESLKKYKEYIDGHNQLLHKNNNIAKI